MKKRLIRYTALALLTMLPSMLYAQLNPKQGYVITNQNDTIYGTIDYLSDTKCANECHFLANGETDYKVYLPGEISAYRFADDGVFYVTKTFEVEGNTETFFAEYLLQGGVSLFHHKRAGIDYYFFIDEEGKVASVKNIGSLLEYSSRSNTNAAKRAALREVSQMFANSDKAQHDLWVKDINVKNLTQITRDYDMEYCTSAGDCVTFRRNEKAARSITTKLRFQAGIGMGSNKLEPTNYALELRSGSLTMNGIVPQIGVGLDFLFPRSNKHWSVQALALLSKWNLSEDYKKYKLDNRYCTGKLKYLDIEGQIGAAYSFMPESKFSPILRGGLSFDHPISLSSERLRAFKYIDENWTSQRFYGYYVGAGIDIAVQKHVIRLSADYRWANLPGVLTKSCISINAGIRL